MIKAPVSNAFCSKTIDKSIKYLIHFSQKVSVCNYNPFATQYAVDFLDSFSSQIDQKNLTAHEKTEQIYNSYYQASSKMVKKNFSNENRKKLGHSLEDILFKCKFNNKPCGVKDFTWMFSNYYGNCYVFNAWNGSETTKTSFIAGPQFGLDLELYANFNQQLNIFNQPFGPAIYIRIENGSSLKGDTLNGVMLPTGHLTYVSLDRVFNHNLKRPYSNCDITEHDNSFDSTLFRLISHSPYAYTQELCLYQ